MAKYANGADPETIPEYIKSHMPTSSNPSDWWENLTEAAKILLEGKYTSSSNLQNSVQPTGNSMPNLISKEDAVNYDPTREQQKRWNDMSTLGKLGTAATMASGGVGGIAAGGVNALRSEGMTPNTVNFNQINQIPGLAAPSTGKSSLEKAIETPDDMIKQNESSLQPPPGIAAPAPDTQAAGVKTAPSYVPDSLKPIFANASQSTGIDQSYLEKMAKRESNFNANAANPGGSAAGLMQFTDPTWQGMVARFGKEYGLTPNGKNDAQQSATAGALYAKQNKQMLTMSLGIQPTNADLYTAHFLGPQGATTFLRASYVHPDRPVTAVLPASVISANKSVFLNKDGSPKTVGEVHSQIEDEFNV